MKTRLFLLLCLSGIAQAQVYTPPPENKPAPAPAQNTATGQEKKSSDGPQGQEIPLLDPAAETITVGGIAIPLGDNRVLKARFEKYLNQAPENGEAAEEYRKTINSILATMSPFRSGGPDFYSAFRLLPRAASYPGDANLCSSLAETIYMAMLGKQDRDSLKKLNESIEQEKDSIILGADWKAKYERDQSVGATRQARGSGSGKNAKPGTPASDPGAGTESLQYAETLRRIAEIEALKKANILKTEAQVLQSKAQYQVNMVQWFMQRRYEHVLMASRFYNQIWKDGDSSLRIDKDSDVAKLFSQSVGVNPTVSSLDSLSNEAIGEVKKYVEAFNLLLSRDELHSASQRLMEAYALGEYLEPVATLPLEKNCESFSITGI